MRAFRRVAFAAASLVVCACATGVSVDDGQGGGPAGGGGAGGGTTVGTTSSTGAGGSTGPCVMKEDCAALDDPCNVGTCINGTCEKTPANESGSCDDGQWCTENDACHLGACVGGTEKYCPSPDSCHLGLCDEAAKACASAPGNDGAACDDGDACTYAGVCSSGACLKGSPVDCSAFDSECGTGQCVPGVGCQTVPKNDGAPCKDPGGTPCTTGQCQAGACIGVPTPTGTPCDDGLFCTVNDACDGGLCSGQPNTCAAPGNVCMMGTCNEAAKTCIAVPGNDGGPCDDHNDCTTGDQCAAGACQPGVPANQGIACDDHDGCTAGTTCESGACTNAQSEITQCIDGDMCCPAGCATDHDCLYWRTGVQQNVDPAALIGWQPCWSGLYGESSPLVSTVLQQCSKAKLLMACRPVGAPTFTLLAMAPRADVLFDCGMDATCAHPSNGVGWYFSDDYSWGFAPAGEAVNRNSCDYNDGSQTVAGLRLCWHTAGSSMNGGYRCGANELNGDFGWERAVYQAD
jgi:hypothetical protein